MNKTILITGCSSGIGIYCAYALKNDGYRVFATARNEKDVQKLEDDGFEAFKLDLNSSDSIKEAVAWTMEKCAGKLDALFNNGAYGQPGFVEDLSDAVLKKQFQTNFFGTVELTNLILPYMREQGYGRIIQNSSVLGFVAMKYRGAYNASKYALEGITDTLRLELEGSSIDVILIQPGPITSDFRKNSLKNFIANIDYKHSIHTKTYETLLERLKATKSQVPFQRGTDAVYDALKHALQSKKPKLKYRVTHATTILWFFKRLLSSRILDRLSSKF